jgi:hypothetical protein
MMGCASDHEWEYTDYNGPPAAGPVLQVTRTGAGVCRLVSTFYFLARKFDDEDRTKRYISRRRLVRARASSGAARGGAAAPSAAARGAAGETEIDSNTRDINSNQENVRH